MHSLVSEPSPVASVLGAVASVFVYRVELGVHTYYRLKVESKYIRIRSSLLWWWTDLAARAGLLTWKRK